MTYLTSIPRCVSLPPPHPPGAFVRQGDCGGGVFRSLPKVTHRQTAKGLSRERCRIRIQLFRLPGWHPSPHVWEASGSSLHLLGSGRAQEPFLPHVSVQLLH